MAEYEIRIPGLTQLFRWRDADFKSPIEQWHERAQRLVDGKSPVPMALRWIPPTLNLIDDVQDLLYTAVFLAKPLLRRLPARFIPYVGWGLLALDLMNLYTFLLGSAMVPCIDKNAYRKSIKGAVHGVKNPSLVYAHWMAPGGWRNWLSFILQGAQALESVTGKGLILGPIMGAMSDGFWGLMRKAFEDDAKIKIKTPKPSILTDKAGYVLAQYPQTYHMHDILSPDDHMKLIMGLNVAVGVLLEVPGPVPDEKAEIVLSSKVPVFLPTNPDILQVCAERGIPVDETCLNHYPDPEKEHRYDDVVDLGIKEYDFWAADIRRQPIGYEEMVIFYSMWREAGMDLLSYLTGIPTETIAI